MPATVDPLVRAVDDSGKLEVGHGPASAIPASDGLAVATIGVFGPWSVSGLLSQVIAPAPGGVRTLASGWTSLVAMDMNGDGLTDLLSDNATTGATINAVAVAGQPGTRVLVNSVAAVPGWTAIVAMNIHGEGGPDIADLLSYNAATGRAFYSVGVRPGVQEIVNAATFPPTTGFHAASGFTLIVPMNINGDALTDLLWYNAATGLAFYSIATAVGAQQIVGPPAHGAPWWTSIVPMKTTPDPAGLIRGDTDLLFYR